MRNFKYPHSSNVINVVNVFYDIGIHVITVLNDVMN